MNIKNFKNLITYFIGNSIISFLKVTLLIAISAIATFLIFSKVSTTEDEQYLSSLSELNYITAKKLVQLDETDYIVIDARDRRLYDAYYIKGSLSIPYNSRKSFKLYFSPEVMLVIYCDSAICSLSKYLGAYLISEGYKNVYVLEGGIDEWHKEDLPIFKK